MILIFNSDLKQSAWFMINCPFFVYNYGHAKQCGKYDLINHITT